MAKKESLIFYVSGRYTGQTVEETDINIRHAENVARTIWRAGFAAICPHTNSAHFDDEANYLTFIEKYMDIVERCDVVVAMIGYQTSLGATVEVAYAERLGKTIIPEIELDDYLQSIQRGNERRDIAGRVLMGA